MKQKRDYETALKDSGSLAIFIYTLHSTKMPAEKEKPHDLTHHTAKQE